MQPFALQLKKNAPHCSHIFFVNAAVMKFICSLLLPLLLLGCAEDKPAVNAQWGTPEYNASQFFHALYVEKDLQKAKLMCTPEYAALIESYGSVRQVGRSMMNMSYDTVEVRVNHSGGNLREQYEDIAQIDILLTGHLDGKQINEMRTVELIKQHGNWLIKTVQVDKFASSAR